MKAATAGVMAGLTVLAVGLPAQAQPVSRQELLNALRERDRVIETMQKRIQALEAGQRPSPKPRVARSSTASAPTVPVAQAEQPQPVRPPDEAPPAPEAQKAEEDDVALQALSRTLVQRGALLLPEWGFEASPSVAYQHTQTEGLVIAPTPEGVSTVVNQRLQDDSIK